MIDFAPSRRKDIVTQSNQFGFHGLGIAPGLLNAISKLKFTEPTPIQRKSIPIALEGKDLIAVAQTGTGKTLGFGIPMIQRLARLKGRGLILVPTRELAIQVDESLLAVGRELGLKTAVLIGGVSEHLQKKALEKSPRIIVATPGRLVDLMEQRIVNLSNIEILVLDEADRMLDMGFAPQLNKIIRFVPKARQTMLFSATMPREIVALAQQIMKIPIQIEIAPAGTTADNVEQEVFFIEKAAKRYLLEELLKQYQGSVLVFSRTKHGAKKLTRDIRVAGFSAAEIHANRSLAQRREALEGFKSGKYRVLIATDIAARGIDVVGIELVVNFDLPTNTQDYVHRIGRTARAGKAGRAISFATFDQREDVREIERLIHTALHVKQVPALPFDRAPRTQVKYESELKQKPKTPAPAFGRGARKPTDREKRRRLR